MSDWIEHTGGPQPVDDGVWVFIKCREGHEFTCRGRQWHWSHNDNPHDIINWRLTSE